MAAGLGVLGYAPDAFWRLTPRELEAALRGRLGGGATEMALTRGELDDLMHQFPDEGARR